MTTYRQNAEAYADGAAVNTATASPQAFTRTTMTGSGTCTVRTSAAIGGSRGFESTGPSGSAAQVGWYDAGGTATNVAASARFKGMAAPAADQRVLNVIGTSASSARPYFIWRSNGNIELWTAAHALVPGWTATAAPTSPSDVLELRLYTVQGTTTTNGRIKGAMLVNGVQVMAVDNTGTNAGTTAFCGAWFGRPTAAAHTATVVWDDAAFDDAATDLIAAVASTPPTPVATAGVRYMVDLRGSTDPEGAPTYACTDDDGLDVDEPVDGLFLITQDSASHELTFTVSQGGDVVDYERTIPPAGAGGGDTLRWRYFDGTTLE